MEMCVDGMEAVRKAYFGKLEEMDDLAEALGMVSGSGFRRMAEEAAPGIGLLLDGNRLGREIREAVASGAPQDEVKVLRRRLIELSVKRSEAGLDLKDFGISGSVALVVAPAVRAVETKKQRKEKGMKKSVGSRESKGVVNGAGKTGKQVEVAAPCPEGSVSGEVMPGHVLGLTGRKYCGRDCVAVRRVPGMFGAKGPAHERTVELTLANGIVNPSELSSDGIPTPYWAVIDAASELGSGFTRQQVVEKAADVIVGAGWKGSREKLLKSCGTAWDVMKGHQNHPTKRDAGIWYMVDEGDSRKVMSIRARSKDETFQYFDAMRTGGDGQVRARKTGPIPTDSHPVVNLVE